MKAAQRATNYTSDLIGNMDKTPMYFDLASNKAVQMKGKKLISVLSTGAEKRWLTVVLSYHRWPHAIPTVVIFKGKRMP